MVQRSQPAMRSQDCHPWQRSHIWGLVLASALSRYVTQKQLYPSQPWWIVFNFLKIMPKLFLFHHSNIFYGTLDNCRDGKEKGLTVQVWVILSTWLLNTSSAEATFWWVFTWKTKLSSYSLLIWRDQQEISSPTTSYLFSNHILFKSLTMKPILDIS